MTIPIEQRPGIRVRMQDNATQVDDEGRRDEGEKSLHARARGRRRVALAVCCRDARERQPEFHAIPNPIHPLE